MQIFRRRRGQDGWRGGVLRTENVYVLNKKENWGKSVKTNFSSFSLSP